MIHLLVATLVVVSRPAAPAQTLDSVGVPDGWKDPAYGKVVWSESPNYNDRPEGMAVDTVVLHHTANSSLGSVAKWFGLAESQVSSHYTIGKNGGIVQHVSTFKRAWHAGVSRDLLGRESVNSFSIGIELVNLGDGKDPWPKEQVEVARFLIMHLRFRFPGLKYVTSHEFIAVPRGRKKDPMAFPWDELKDTGLELVYDMTKRKDPPANLPTPGLVIGNR